MIAQENYQHAIESRLRELIPFHNARQFEKTPYLDRWLATSLLQKSIRRDKPELAWQGASHLLENYPAYFWRRLPIIAMEDIGLGDLDLTMMAILAGASAQLRVELGGCLLTATALIELMCAATKDRSTDDLFDVVSRCPILLEERIAMSENGQPDEWSQNIPPVRGVLSQANLMFHQADSVDDLPVFNLKKTVWADVIHHHASATTQMGLAETALLGLRTTGIVLAPMLVAVGNHVAPNCPTVDDPILGRPKGTKIPTWALGQHTRIGLEGFRRYVSQSHRIRTLLTEAADGSVSRPKTIGGLVYRLDCGQLKHRRDCDLASDLKKLATHIGWGIKDAAVPEALSILTDEFDLVNACRAEALMAYLT